MLVGGCVGVASGVSTIRFGHCGGWGVGGGGGGGGGGSVLF
jgi:hypothetical protein